MNREIGHGWYIFSISFKQSIAIFEKKKGASGNKGKAQWGFFCGVLMFYIFIFVFC
jgi:hypothetical protein